MPKVSVLMPIRNAERTVEESVESILRQSFRDFEFLICDDASTDNTAKILLSFDDKRIRIINNKKKKGVAASLNRLLRIARGEFICRIDADDIAHKDRLKTQGDFLQTHPNIGLVGSWFEEIDDDGRRIRTVRFPPTHHEIRRVLPHFNPIRHPTMMVRRLILKYLNGYDSSLDGAEDYDLVIRAARVTQLANIPKVLLQYRVGNQSVSVSETQRILRQAIRTRWKALRSGDFRWWESIFLLKSLVTFLVPPALKRWVMEVVR